MIVRRLRRLLACLLVLSLGWPAGLASASPSDGSTLANDRGIASSAPPVDSGAAADLFTGAATYQIPIDVPPGTGGMTPQLALAYSSDFQADSWVGFGWSLGLPSVQRSLRKGVPTYVDDSDDFELAGEPLVPTPGGPADFYRTRSESFSRIEYDPANDQWTVLRPDGTKLLFGVSDNARIKNGSSTFQWLLSRQEDPHGNYFAVTYDVTTDPGTAYPQAIQYTLRDGSPSLPAPATQRLVEFVLEEDEREDQPVNHAGGFLRRLAHRLDRVDVRVNGELLRRYDLTYDASDDSFRSLLTEVAVFGSDGESQSSTA